MPSHQLPSDDYILAMITVLTGVSPVGMTLLDFEEQGEGGPGGVRCVASQSGAILCAKSSARVSTLPGSSSPSCSSCCWREDGRMVTARICWTITIVGTSMDFARLHVGFIARNWPMRSILREHEHKQLTGGCYFSLGCTLAICE